MLKAIDFFCGLGGWTEGLLAEGYAVTGYDIEAHEYLHDLEQDVIRVEVLGS